MWNGLLSYFSNSSHVSSQPTQQNSEESNDWVFVDNSGQEITKEDAEKRPELDDDIKQTRKNPRLSPLPLLDVTNKSSSPQDSSSSSPSKVEDGWYITPPPCFTLNCPTKLEISPLENLLIEHPSMSVYANLPGSIRRTLFQTKLEPDIEEKSVDDEHEYSSCPEFLKIEKLRNLPFTPPPTVTFSEPPSFEKTVVCCKLHDLKDFLNHIENLKPSEYAKYCKEQYKLRPSFIRRQNLVRSSRNVCNAKKRCVVKPFGEKCKRSF